jgi:hypothetical protein
MLPRCLPWKQSDYVQVGMNCASSISGPSWRYILEVSPVVVYKMGRLVDIFCDMFASCLVTVLSIIFFCVLHISRYIRLRRKSERFIVISVNLCSRGQKSKSIACENNHSEGDAIRIIFKYFKRLQYCRNYAQFLCFAFEHHTQFHERCVTCCV